jgi:NADPH-dependent stearoyl-CoA 9-desaturase
MDRTLSGELALKDALPRWKRFLPKAARQLAKDYVLFPLLAGPAAPLVFAGNLTANGVRNVWAFTVIFCGHFPEGAQMYSQADVEHETRGAWLLRQIRGSANIRGSKWLHILSGNLSHQIEHHLFPDLPAFRYAEVAPEVQAVCRQYGVPYTTGRMGQQVRSFTRRILRFSLPTRPQAVRQDAPIARPSPASPAHRLATVPSASAAFVA